MLKNKNWLSYCALFTGFIATNSTLAASKYNFPDPVSPLTRDVYDLHMLTSAIAIGIMVVVTAVIVYAIFKFRKSAGYEADQNFHTSKFGVWSWVLVPIIVLGIDLSIAGPGTKTLRMVEAHIPADITVKVTGSQWRWTYEYLEDGIKIVSNLVPKEPTDPLYLRDVDDHLVLPVNTQVRLLHTATDVLHNWWVPAIAIKKDSIPGYINETYTNVDTEGTYFGQCAENCGTGHALMPIKVEVLSKEKYAIWLNDRKASAQAAAAEAASNKLWSKDDLMAKGEAVYQKTCMVCHGAAGEGIPNVFPALKDSPIIKGDLKAHMDIVIKGKAGTAMAAWGPQLNDLELAAVITYERNAWGNDTGDTIQSADVRNAR